VLQAMVMDIVSHEHRNLKSCPPKPQARKGIEPALPADADTSVIDDGTTDADALASATWASRVQAVLTPALGGQPQAA
jgi:hypothetical protein